MKSLRVVICNVLLVVLTIVKLQGQERPPIQIYTPNQYGAENQNWALSQSEDKYIYVANNKGLLEFNGANWTLYPSPNNTIIRTVKVVDGLIYTGSYGAFGYWSKNAFGTLDYTALSKELDITLFEDEEFWNIFSIDDIILFQSLNRIFIYDVKEQSYNTVISKSSIHKMYQVNESVYFQDINNGLFEIFDGRAKLHSDHGVFKSNLLANIFLLNGELIYLTEDNGFYYFKNNDLLRWEIPANERLLKRRIYSSSRLRNGNFLLGTVSKGLCIISEKGKIIYDFNQTTGLGNNTVLSLFEDLESNVWLGLENGINCININSAFKVYDDYSEKIGAVNASVLHHSILYLGTNQGVFYKKYNSAEEFELIPNTKGAVWSLRVINDVLFCGHNSGTFIIKENEAQFINGTKGTWDIKSIEGRDNLLLQGNYTGLYILEEVNGSWKVRNKVDNFETSSRYFEMIGHNEILVSHEYKGVFKLGLDTNLTKVIKTEKDNSVEKGLKTSLVKYNNDILYGHSDGIYKYDLTNSTFLKDSVYSSLYSKNEFTSGKLVPENETNKLWSFTKGGVNYITPGKLSSALKINRVSLPSNARHDVSGYENIAHLENNRYLYGTSLGYIIINLYKRSKRNRSFRVSVTKISNGNFGEIERLSTIDRTEASVFDYTNNNLEFKFSIPEYRKYSVSEYQYKLDGIHNDWSNWSTKANAIFENLPYGDYKFRVRGRLGNQYSENTETYNFTILRPWYISNIMIGVYIGMIALFSMFMHQVYKRYYRKQREQILQKKQRQIERKELENKEQIARFNNDKLRQDIDNKNRELAISTMSLIKKNEFLNTIKKELQETTDVNKIINIIDKNINNTDDWRLFEEAFNNADKDFLKKIKSLHPELTSNDLRLCAYLRLNLSSKEIAPLLNISPKSVEVKRYRLRKKMNLEHEASLTDYILEI